MNYERAFEKIKEAIVDSGNEKLQDRLGDILALERFYARNPEEDPDNTKIKEENVTENTEGVDKDDIDMFKILDNAKQR